MLIKLFATSIFFSFLSSCSYLTPIERKEKTFRGAWSKNLDPSHATGNLPIALNSPAIHEGILYIGENEGYLSAYELSNGTPIFRVEDEGGHHGTPIIIGDYLIYGTNEGRVYSRHKHTGEINYSVDLGSSIETKAVYHRGQLFFHTRNHKIFCLDAETGKILWAYKRSVPYLTTLQRASTPLVYKGKLYVGMADGHLAAFSLEEGTLLWERKIVEGSKFIDTDIKPSVYKGQILTGSMNGEAYLLSASTGRVHRKLPWGMTRSPFRLKTGQLIFPQLNGELIITDENLKVEKRFFVSKYSISAISFWKGRLAVGTLGGEVLSVNLKNFKVDQIIQPGHGYSAIFGEMAASEKYLAVFTSRNRLYVYR